MRDSADVGKGLSHDTAGRNREAEDPFSKGGKG